MENPSSVPLPQPAPPEEKITVAGVTFSAKQVKSCVVTIEGRGAGQAHRVQAMTTAEPRERYLSVKEIIAEMDALGLRFSELAVRERMRAGITRNGYNCRLSDFIAFCEKNPDFCVRPKNAKPEAKPARRRIPATSV